MTAQQRPYVRVYYEIFQDPKFEKVVADKATLGWWLTLLVGADAMFPAPAILPRGIPDEVVSVLAEVELIDLLPNDFYRVHGLATERRKRSEKGLAGAQARWSDDAKGMRSQSDRTATAMHSSPRPREIEPKPLRRGGLSAMSEVLPRVTDRLKPRPSRG